MKPPSDIHGRKFKTLRVSLTPVCNFACLYCTCGDENAGYRSEEKNLSLSGISAHQDFFHIIKSIHALTGLETVRLTGGEPLAYKEILPLVASLKELGIPQVKLTTNASLLRNLATPLKKAGVDSINISIDAMDPEVFYQMTRRKSLHKTLDGIDAALENNIPVKLNAVVMRGINEHQLLPLLDFAFERNIVIRFLELMQMGHLHHNSQQYFFPEKEMLDIIGEKYTFVRVERTLSSTARYWLTTEMDKFGIISNTSHPFCSDCNRLRLDSSGKIYGCLSEAQGIPIADCLGDEKEMFRRLEQALGQKQMVFKGSEVSMKEIGG